MSMMGRFVQVSPDRLKQILDDPSGVEELLREQSRKVLLQIDGSARATDLRTARRRCWLFDGRDQLTGSG